MKEGPYHDVAQDFLNLWQRQLSLVVSDKKFIHAMLELMQSFQHTDSNGKKRNQSTADPANPSHDEHGVLAEFAFRLAMCEKRLSALESGSKAKAKPAKRAGSRRRKGSKAPRK